MSSWNLEDEVRAGSSQIAEYSPRDSFSRFGLNLDREDLDQLGAALRKISEAERSAEREAVGRRIF